MVVNGLRRMAVGTGRRRQHLHPPSVLLLCAFCIGVCLLLRLSMPNSAASVSSTTAAQAQPSSAVVESTEPPHSLRRTPPPVVLEGGGGAQEHHRHRQRMEKAHGHEPDDTTTRAIAARMVGHVEGSQDGSHGILVVDKRSKAAAAAKARERERANKKEREKMQREHAKQLAQDMDPMIARELEEALAPPPVIAGSEVRTLRIPSSFPEFVLHRCTHEARIMLLSRSDFMNMTGLPRNCPSMYPRDMHRLFKALPPSYQNRTFLARFGDRTTPLEFPALTKARTINDSNAILLPLNYDHHFLTNFVPVLGGGDPVPYRNKTPIAVWRGASTGGCYNPAGNCTGFDYGTDNGRKGIVLRWALANHAKVDVGFNNLVQSAASDYFKAYKPYVKKGKSVQELLEYRYLIAVEGNDVPTGLKWMLASNSTVMMVPPRFETWLLEGRLRPYVHYVPLAPDFSDIPDKVLWCERNLDECEAIAHRATEFVKFYGDVEHTWQLAVERLRAYLDVIHVEVVEDQQRRGHGLLPVEDRTAAAKTS